MTADIWAHAFMQLFRKVEIIFEIFLARANKWSKQIRIMKKQEYKFCDTVQLKPTGNGPSKLLRWCLKTFKIRFYSSVSDPYSIESGSGSSNKSQSGSGSRRP